MTDADPSVTVTGPIKEALRGTKGWVKLVGILMFVGAAFTVLGALVAIIGAAAIGGAKYGAGSSAMVAGMSGFYIVMAVVYIFLGMYLLSYSGAIGRLLVDNQVATLEAALQAQQKFWRLAGILAIIGMVIALIGIVAAIAIPMMAYR